MSNNGIAHLKSFEGLRLKAYDDKQPNTNISHISQVKGTLTIGYGHTKGVKVGDTITEAKAVELLKQDLQYYENIVAKKVKVPLTQNMADALIDFCYNVGEGNFGSSTLLKRLNEGNYQAAADQFLVWKIPASILPRRQAERALFLKDFGVSAYIYNSEVKESNLIVDALKLIAVIALV